MGRRKVDFIPQRPPEHICACKGCDQAGEYRAPKDKSLKEYHWFCLKHVQEYNAQWNYYQDMSAQEIESALRFDIGWQRPTWEFGSKGSVRFYKLDPLNVHKNGFFKSDQSKTEESSADPALIAATCILEVTFPLDFAQVRQKYKVLAKKYHPDSTGGDKDAEEKFKDMTNAYRLIKSFLKK